MIRANMAFLFTGGNAILNFGFTIFRQDFARIQVSDTIKTMT